MDCVFTKWLPDVTAKYPLTSNVGEVQSRTAHEGPQWEWRYSSPLSLTSALDGGGCQRHAPAALPPGKNRYPLYRAGLDKALSFNITWISLFRS